MRTHKICFYGELRKTSMFLLKETSVSKAIAEKDTFPIDLLT